MLLAMLVLGMVAYVGYVYGNMVGRTDEYVTWTPFLYGGNGGERQGEYEEKIRQLQAIGDVKWDIIMEYDTCFSLIAEKKEKTELLERLRRLEILWQTYDMLMAKYGPEEDTLTSLDTE